MSDPTFKTPKEGKLARRKVTTDLGRQIMQRERQRLAREQAALGEQLAEEAKRMLNKKQSNKRTVQPEQIAVTRGIIKRIGAVLQTEGVDAKIITKQSETMSAWTDFEQIVVNYRMHDDVRLLAATLRGLIYHEGGHMRWSLPYRQLLELTGRKYGSEFAQYHKAWNMLEDQRMETAVVSDSPRKAAYLTPVIMTEMTDTINSAAANWPLLIWRKYLPSKIRKGARKMFVAKHNLMGLDGEALAKAWERVTTEYVMADNANDMFTAVVTAFELLKMTNTIPGIEGDMGHGHHTFSEQSNLDDALVIPVSSDMLTDGELLQEDDAPQPVIDTTDPIVAEHLGKIIVALFSHPETLLRIVYAVPTPSESEPQPGTGSASEPTDEDGDESEDADSDEEDASDEQGESTAGGGSEDDDEADGSDADEDDTDSGSQHGSDDDADEDGDEQDEDDDGEGADAFDDADDDEEDEHYANEGPRTSGVDPEREGGSEGEHDDEEVEADLDYTDRSDEDEELTDEELAEALAEAEAARDEDDALDGDVQAFQEALDNRVSDLVPYMTHASGDLEATAAAHNLADELEQSFYASTMDSAPQWQEQQRRGVLNVMRYKTRRPGDVEFFKAWTEDDAPGFNLAVSILLDYSGSMGGYTEELAQAGYASKLACSKLGIPCTVVLWDTNARVLWDANEEAEYLPVIESAGATNPSVALADLQNQRYEKQQHVVLIMTDGEWQDNADKYGYLATYNEQGRIFIGCGFNSGYGSSEHLADKLRRYGCDESYAIKNLMEIPALLEQTLVAVA